MTSEISSLWWRGKTWFKICRIRLRDDLMVAIIVELSGLELTDSHEPIASAFNA